MIRTQLYLPERLYQELDLLAKRKRQPKAKVIRELLEKGVSGQTRRGAAGRALLRLAQIGARGPKDLSKRIDEILYS